MKSIYLLLFCVILFSCQETPDRENKNKLESSQQGDDQKDIKALDIAVLEEGLGLKGNENEGEFKVTIPQNDLNVTVDGFKIIPPMGLGSWVAFTPTKNQPMIMGDVVVTEQDLKPVQQEVIKQGLTITAIHNHFVRNEPDVMYMHIGGMGSEKELAQKVKAVLDIVEKSRGGNPSAAASVQVENTLDTNMIDSILGHKGNLNNGVLDKSYSINWDDYRNYRNSFYEFIRKYDGYDFTIPSRDVHKTIRKRRPSNRYRQPQRLLRPSPQRSPFSPTRQPRELHAPAHRHSRSPSHRTSLCGPQTTRRDQPRRPGRSPLLN